MTVIIELSPEKEAALRAQAQTYGMTVDQWLLRLAEQQIPERTESIAHLQRTNPQEWMRQFRAWAESHDRTTPLLTDDAISRENIYPDRT